MLPVERQDLMLGLADLVAAHEEEIAHLEALEQGKLLELARAIEVDMAVDYLRYMAGWATKIRARRSRSRRGSRKGSASMRTRAASRSASWPESSRGTSPT